MNTTSMNAITISSAQQYFHEHYNTFMGPDKETVFQGEAVAKSRQGVPNVTLVIQHKYCYTHLAAFTE
jgi:hypothetical protein